MWSPQLLLDSYGHRPCSVRNGWRADIACLACSGPSKSPPFAIRDSLRRRRSAMLGIMMRSPRRGKLAVVFGILALAGIAVALAR